MNEFNADGARTGRMQCTEPNITSLPKTPARVFVVTQNMPYDVRSAKGYGEFAYILPENMNSPFNPGAVAKATIESLEKQGFDPEKDFVCMTAPSNMIAFVLAAIACGWENFTVLIYDARTKIYTARRWSDPCEQ
jgi:hypothetical protein